MARILKEVFVFHLQNRWNALTLENKTDHAHNSETSLNEKELKYDVMWDANLLGCVTGACRKNGRARRRHPSRVSLLRARSLFCPLLPSACYACYKLTSQANWLGMCSLVFSTPLVQGYWQRHWWQDVTASRSSSGVEFCSHCPLLLFRLSIIQSQYEIDYKESKYIHI